MSFEAVVASQENKLLWCRCLHALSVLSEEICFIATASQLVVSARNTGDTTFMDTIFQKPFFKSYYFYSDSIEEGVHSVKGESAYSLTVRSRLLSILFKKHEDDIDNFKVSFDATAACPSNRKFRLQIEIMTKNFIQKRFTPYYNPSYADLSNLADVYKQDLIRSKSTRKRMPNSTNYIMMSNSMLKGFLDTVNSQTEHLKIEVNHQRFSLMAFTRGVFIKEKEILKQPMAIHLQFRSEDLHGLEIGNENYSVTLRFKDFKNFLTLTHPGEVTECYFKGSGDPIFFEIIKNNVTLQLIQDTDGENHITNNANESLRKTVKPKLHQMRSSAQAENQHVAAQQDEQAAEVDQPLFVPNDDDEEAEEAGNDNDGDDINDNNGRYDYNNDLVSDVPRESNSKDDYEASNGAAQEEARISWGDPSTESIKLNKLISTRKQVIEDARSEYLEAVKKRKFEQQSTEKSDQELENEELQELGPTQNITKVKGIFD